MISKLQGDRRTGVHPARRALNCRQVKQPNTEAWLLLRSRPRSSPASAQLCAFTAAVPLTHIVLPCLLPSSSSPFQIQLGAPSSEQPSFTRSLLFSTQARHPATPLHTPGMWSPRSIWGTGPLDSEYWVLNLTHREHSANVCRRTGELGKPLCPEWKPE